MYCSKCGIQVKEDAKFCHSCGTSLNVKGDDKDTNDNFIETNKDLLQRFGFKSKYVLPVIIILALILILSAYKKNNPYGEYAGFYMAEYNGIDYIELKKNRDVNVFSNGINLSGTYRVLGNKINLELNNGMILESDILLDKISGGFGIWIKTSEKPDKNLEKEVVIFDKKLEKRLRNLLNINSNGRITISHMQSIKELDLPAWGIEELSGLEYATNIEFVNLADNNIIDIHELSNLSKLKYLNLSYNQILDISPLSDLTSIEDLRLTNNNVSDIKPISKLKSIYRLELISNQVTDFSPLADLKNIKELSVRGNPISLGETISQVDECKFGNISYLDIYDVDLMLQYQAFYEQYEPIVESSTYYNEEESYGEEDVDMGDLYEAARADHILALNKIYDNVTETRRLLVEMKKTLEKDKSQVSELEENNMYKMMSIFDTFNWELQEEKAFIIDEETDTCIVNFDNIINLFVSEFHEYVNVERVILSEKCDATIKGLDEIIEKCKDIYLQNDYPINWEG